MFAVSVSKNSAITFVQYTSVSAKNKSKYRSLKNLLKLKNLVDIGGVSLSVTIGLENFTDDVGGGLTIFWNLQNVSYIYKFYTVNSKNFNADIF